MIYDWVLPSPLGDYRGEGSQRGKIKNHFYTYNFTPNPYPKHLNGPLLAVTGMGLVPNQKSFFYLQLHHFAMTYFPILVIHDINIGARE
jgi:hypothetical protein